MLWVVGISERNRDMEGMTILRLPLGYPKGVLNITVVIGGRRCRDPELGQPTLVLLV